MNAVNAKYQNGQVVLSHTVDWPDGTQVMVEPLVASRNRQSPDHTRCVVEQENDPDSIARWLQWYDSLQPLIFTSEEEGLDVENWAV